MHLDDMRLFAEVAELASFSAAARRLDLTPAAVSAAIKRIEATLKARLLERSTRSVRLTAEGERVAQACRSMLSQWQGLQGALARPGDVDGEVHLAAPADTTYRLLSPWLAPWLDAQPGLRLHLHVSDRLHDLKREAVDIAIRYRPLADSSLVARQLCRGSSVLVASPGYVAQHGAPTRPGDLLQHRCLTLQIGGRLYRDWPLRRRRARRAGGADEVVRVDGVLCGDGALAHAWALEGRGIAFKALCDVLGSLETGRLVQLLPDHVGPDLPVHAVLPSREFVPPRVRAVLDELAARFAALQARMDAWKAPG